MSGPTWGLIGAVFLASVVEFVEALTIVLAMGVTRGWRSTLAGVATAVVALVGFTAVAGYALSSWLPEAALQFVVGTLLLVFGLQWLRKAILRSSGLMSLHDEAAEYESQTETARAADGAGRSGLDTFAFVVAFKGVFLEGVEVVFVVITFGLSAENMPAAVTGAVAGGLLVVGSGVYFHKPLTAIPENTLKYGVGLLLASFGTFWACEGLGIFVDDGESLHWPGSDLAILILLAAWFGLSRLLIAALPAVRPATPRPEQSREVVQ